MNQKTKYFLVTLCLTIFIGGIFYGILILRSPEPTIQKEGGKSPATENYDKNQGDGLLVAESARLVIPKINVLAPINLNIDGNVMEEYMKSLETGVAHMAKTTLPGEQGNSVIFGHSSYYADKPGDYKEIFSKLNELTEGDEIRIESESSQLSYKVAEKKIVDPKDISVVNQDLSAKKITLITCWPIKTTEKRLVVAATTN